MTNPQFAVANLLTQQSPAPAGNASAERRAHALLKRTAGAPETRGGFSANLADPAGASPLPAGAADGQAGQAAIRRSAARTKQDKPPAGTPAGAKQTSATAQAATAFAALVQQLAQVTPAGPAQPTPAKSPVPSAAKTTKTPPVQQFAMGLEQPRPASGQPDGARRTLRPLAPIASHVSGKTAYVAAGAQPQPAEADPRAAAQAKPAGQAVAAAAKAVDASGAAAAQAAKAAPDAVARPRQSPKTTGSGASAAAIQAAVPAAGTPGAPSPAKADIAVAAVAMASPNRHAAAGGRASGQAPTGIGQTQTGANAAGGAFRPAQAAARAESLNVEISEIARRAKDAADDGAAPPEQSAAAAAGGRTHAAEASGPRAAVVHTAAVSGPAAARSPADQIADAIPAGGAGDGERIVLRLTPPDLGTVRITFERDGEGVRGTVQADNPRTLVEIQREASALAERMAASGIELRKLDVQLSSQGGDRDFSGGSGFSDGDGRQWQHEFRDGSAASDEAVEGGSPPVVGVDASV
jgi:hypothetical protein